MASKQYVVRVAERTAAALGALRSLCPGATDFVNLAAWRGAMPAEAGLRSIPYKRLMASGSVRVVHVRTGGGRIVTGYRPACSA